MMMLNQGSPSIFQYVPVSTKLKVSVMLSIKEHEFGKINLVNLQLHCAHCVE